MEDLWGKPKRVTLSEVLRSCEEVLRQPKGKKTRVDAFWSEKRLEPFIKRMARRLDREANPAGDLRSTLIQYDIWCGGPPTDFHDEDERAFAELVRVQVGLLEIALQTDDPMGVIHGPWEASPRRPSSNGYTQEFLRAVCCLVQKDKKGYRSFNACWEAHNIPKSSPKIPTEYGKRMTSTRAARLLSNLLTATTPPKNWSEANLKAAQNNAKLATVEFGLDLAMLEKLAAR